MTASQTPNGSLFVSVPRLVHMVTLFYLFDCTPNQSGRITRQVNTQCTTALQFGMHTTQTTSIHTISVLSRCSCSSSAAVTEVQCMYTSQRCASSCCDDSSMQCVQVFTRYNQYMLPKKLGGGTNMCSKLIHHCLPVGAVRHNPSTWYPNYVAAAAFLILTLHGAIKSASSAAISGDITT